MSRELVLFVVALSLGGLSLIAWGFLPPRERMLEGESGRDLERAAWRRLWLPALPAVVVVAILLGWASQEPAQTDECLGVGAAALLLPLLWVAARAALRAGRALGDRTSTEPARTSGVLRPRVFVNDAFCRELDEPSLEAAYAHERAHARHRDPLRLWLAQLVTDMQWPGRAATARLRDWRATLELARDEEARLSGVTGEDLAAAIIAALRHHRGEEAAATAGLVSADDILRERIRRLLAPVPPQARASSLLPVVIVGLLSACAVFGHFFGDAFLRALPFISAQ